jgi:hypothetical protein
VTVATDQVTPDGAAPDRPPRPLLTLRRVAAAIVAAQAVLYGLLASAGYFYVDDLDNLATAARHPLDGDYLTLPLNDHFTPGLRLSYWLMAHVAPYQHGVTVLARLAVQVAATVLFYRLLLRLFGPRPAVLVGLAAYAFCPLTLPSFLSLSSAVNLLPAHVAVILLLDSHVRYAATGRLRYAATGGLALLVGLLFWEKVALAVLLPPLLTAVLLTGGGWRERAAALLRQWRGFACYLLPLVFFFGYYFAAGYPGSRDPATVGRVADLARTGWLRGVGPAAAGGPWTWFSTDSVYFGVADPPPAAVVAGQLVLLGLAALGVRRRGWASLACWSMPVVYLLGTSVVLAVGRYQYFGGLVATNFHYLSDLTVPLVLAGMAALVPVELAALPRRAVATLGQLGPAGTPVPLPAGRARLPAAALAVALVASTAVSAAGFERRWVQNPTRDFLGTLLSTLRSYPGTNIYDVPLSSRVLPVVSENRRPSYVLAPLEVPVSYDDPRVPLRTVDDLGRVVEAVFVPAAESREQPGVFCSHPLSGAQRLTVPLTRRAPEGDHVVVVDYLAERALPVSFRVVGSHGAVDPVGGPSRELRGGLQRVLLEVAGTDVTQLEVSSELAAVKLCIAHVEVGYPVPAGRGG